MGERMGKPFTYGKNKIARFLIKGRYEVRTPLNQQTTESHGTYGDYIYTREQRLTLHTQRNAAHKIASLGERRSVDITSQDHQGTLENIVNIYYQVAQHPI